jgi:monoamine oxidase
MSNERDKQPDLDRRQFIRGAGALAAGSAALVPAAAVLASERPTACKTQGCDYDVLVIGGGFAGVTAARDSRENGYKTLLLEARNRMGGRTFTSTFEGDAVELGGTWIHWTQPFVWAEKQRYDLAIKETPGAAPDRMILRHKGQTRDLTEEQIYSVMQAFQAVTADARAILERPWDTRFHWDKVLEADKLSTEERMNQLDLSPLQRVCLESLFAASAHNTISEWSYMELLRWTGLAGFNDFLLYLDASARYTFKKGTASLLEAMLDDGKPEVRLSTPVKKVEDLGGRIRVTTGKGEEIIAGTVICTVPMNVLPGIEFSPALDQRLVEAAEERHNGKGVKLYIRVRGKQGKVFGMSGENHPISSLFTYKEGEDHTLFTGFGIDSQAMDYYDEEAIQNAVRDYLPEAEVESTFSYDWVLEPYSKGTWASYKPGWMEKYYDHFNKDSGNILFASGDHGDGWRGFIDGAIGAGSKAAERARKILG